MKKAEGGLLGASGSVALTRGRLPKEMLSFFSGRSVSYLKMSASYLALLASCLELSSLLGSLSGRSDGDSASSAASERMEQTVSQNSRVCFITAFICGYAKRLPSSALSETFYCLINLIVNDDYNTTREQ
eukprot:TRINITY_DN12384_c0_g1_i4.p2 TRINITY_DN12384_c0_g1~~TRINITY_DN12384_c0_g1_i4.p2  ORF type:complete len:130 (-),score=10.91 TRINITY_DN12384_c0_g1_i4:170-559(-)